MRERQAHTIVAAGLMAAAAAVGVGLAPEAQARPVRPPISTQVPSPKPAARFDGHKLVRAHIQTQQELDQLMDLGALPWSCITGVGDGEFLLSPQAMARLAASGIRADVLIDNVQPLIDASLARMRQQIIDQPHFMPQPGDLKWFEDYKTYSQVNEYLDALVAFRPDLASTFTIGTSGEGRAIHGIRITAPPTAAITSTGSKPALLIDGCQHAREWISVMVPMFIADYLVRNYDLDPQARAIVDKLEIDVIPIVNVDGFEFTYAVDGNRLWRKNRRDNGDGSFGVDLNRNWAVDWAGPHSTSRNGLSDLYYGTAAFSEPETLSLSSFIQAHTQLRGHIDFHNYSQLVFQPWSHQYPVPALDGDVLDAITTDMNAAIHSVHQVNYFNGWPGHLLYLASGTMPDWCYGERNMLSFTIELRDNGASGFLLPPEEIIPTSQENLQAVFKLADWLTRGVEYFYPRGIPPRIDAGAPTTVQVDIHPLAGGAIDSNAVKLYSRVGSTGVFEPSDVIDLGNHHYEVTLPPASCGEVVQYYLETAVAGGLMYRSPAQAPAQVHQSQAVTTLTNFDFESHTGWTTSAIDAYYGFWDHGIPVVSPNWPYDPDSDADGSGQCYVTGNSASYFGDADVDGGSVVLTSPAIDMSAFPGSGSAADGGGAVISYSYFLHLVSVGDDSLVVEINSNDGAGPWTEIARDDTNGGVFWRQNAVTQAQLESLGVALTATMKLRFIVTDADPQSIVEGGIDGVKISTACDGPPHRPPACLGDIAPEGGNGAIDIDDLVLVITGWNATSGPADINGDHIVNIDDLVAVITHWGACP